MVFKDYYKILGVSFSASPEEIKRSYRKLALRFHPDTTAGDKAAELKFREVKEAYEILSRPVRRESFDYDYKKYYQTGATSSKSNGQQQTTQTRQNVYRPQQGTTKTAPKGDGSSLTAAAYLARTNKIFYTYTQHGLVADQSKLYSDLSSLLQPSNIKQLLVWGDTKTNKAIVKQCLAIMNLLSYKYIDALGLRLAQLAGTDNETINSIFKYCKNRKRKVNAQRVVLIAAMILIFILFLLLIV
jgi:hypothetical protein